MSKILVIGGAGYIGSHMAAELHDAGHNPVILDNISTGNKNLAQNFELIEGNFADEVLLDRIFTEYNFEAILHFAALSQVKESIEYPEKYHQNNVVNTATLLNKMAEHNINNFIFSSTAAVYGNPITDLIDESHPCTPINPYGETKLAVEEMLAEHQAHNGLKYGVLRYFNAAGAHPKYKIGEMHDPETHLIPLVLQAASGRRSEIKIFGSDYNTPDGTCIRDYIHVCDLANAHLKLLEYIKNSGTQTTFNLGTSRGYSILEIINTAKEITGINIKTSYEDRREGDPQILVADGSKAQQILDWKPQSSDLENIIKTAWEWEKQL